MLTFTRERTGSLTPFSMRFNTFWAAGFSILPNLVAYFLRPCEFRVRRAQLINEYYNYLAISLLMGRRDPNSGIITGKS